MDLNEFLEDKYGRRFVTLDVNGSGLLEPEDYEEAATRMCALSGTRPDLGSGRRLVEAYRAAHRSLARAAGAPYGIGRKEFTAVMCDRLAGRPEAFDHGMAAVGELVFEVCDIDRDGFLDERDYCRFLAGYGVPRDAALEAVRRLAPTGRLRLGREEFLAHSRDFYCGTDPAAPGTWMFGVF
ncbi:hypothetical protein [Streptomyces sp. NPDC005805]|uniref:EF-hand domain-containing protein n=1 Tax=Streptomyces sp. NPDC005805 TaxID=3157068 RepID=UPI0033C32441